MTEDSTGAVPKWLHDLECKERKTKLAHEIGAGASCIICHDGCPGLDLHFWRKTCRNCKCRKEDHDIKDDDDGCSQFEILFGKKQKNTGGALKFRVSDEYHDVSEKKPDGMVQFEWLPPGVSAEVASDYMKHIPVGKRPIKGSVGASFRRCQLQKQLPLHDVDPSKCHDLTPEEIDSLNKYLDGLRGNFAQGQVMKINPQIAAESQLPKFMSTLQIQPQDVQNIGERSLPTININNKSCEGQRGIVDERKIPEIKSQQGMQQYPLPYEISVSKESSQVAYSQVLPYTEAKHYPPQESDSNKFVGQQARDYQNKINCDIVACHECLKDLKPGEVAVFAHVKGKIWAWHPQCFVCFDCKELLVDLVYFVHNSNVYCERDYANIMFPRCHACDELIFSKEYTNAEGKNYHFRHFCCFECDEPLGGKGYVLHLENPTCLPCFKIKYGKLCQTCKTDIPIGDQRISIKDLHWHMSPDCFCCTFCKTSLVNRKMVLKDDNPYCDKNCYLANNM